MKTLNSIFVATFIAFACPIFLSAQTVTDIEGNVYNTVTIGTQVWMKENLKTSKYCNGDTISTTDPSDIDLIGDYPSAIDTTALTVMKYQWVSDYNNANLSSYGRIYTWYAVVDNRNVCPIGWHVPSDIEWQILVDYLGGSSIAGGKMKEAGLTHWEYNELADNSSGFTALPAGYRYHDGVIDGVGDMCWFWSSTSTGNNGAYFRSLENESAEIFRDSVDAIYNGHNVTKILGYSVRCIKDATSDINDVQNTLNMKVCPNPATDLVTINLNFDQKTDTRIELFDVVGQRVKLISDFESNKDQITFHVGELPHGLYLIKVTDSEGRSVSKRLMK